MKTVKTPFVRFTGTTEIPSLSTEQAGLPQAKPSHLFVDNVRFWSMFAVVALHSTQIIAQIVHLRPYLVIVVTTPIKFGTIAFFLMSGFLAGRGLETAHPWIYLRRPMDRILPPWCCWIGAMVLCLLVKDVIHHRVGWQAHALLSAAGQSFSFCFLDTPFWFVPNLLVCLGILLLFRRMQGSRLFGATLCGLSLFYAANIYATWIPSRHTEALFGFVFYLWLGSYVAREHANFDRWIGRISFVWFFLLAGMLGLLAFGEAQFLFDRGAEDPMNSLRLSNQAFSVAAVLLIYKFRRATWPRFVDVREDTFGIYLSHPLVLLLLWPILNTQRMEGLIHRSAENGMGAVILLLCAILVLYGLSLILTKALAAVAPLRSLVGLEAAKAPSNKRSVPVTGRGEALQGIPRSA